MAKKNQTSFNKDNQPSPENRTPRGKSKKTLMLDAIRQHCGVDGKPGNEMDYLLDVIKASLGDPLSDPPILPNPTLMTIVMSRIEPPLKSTSPLVEFEFSAKATPSEQASQVLTAAAKGEIPPDIAHTFVSAIASMLKIDEVTELQKRLESLEKAMGIGNG
ncbi:MAG: hypothetical protein V7765_21240 [Oleispira sp.]